jgi:hypothetical protein
MVIEDCSDSYDKASEDQTTQFSQEIVVNVHHAGGRSKKDYAASGDQATNIHVIHNKVAHSFGSLRSQCNRSLIMLQKSRTETKDRTLQFPKVNPGPFMLDGG